MLLCNHCGSREYRKSGLNNLGEQRYYCKSCNRYFCERPRKFTYSDKSKALDMHLNNVGVRKIARFIGCSPALVIRWIRDFGNRLSLSLSNMSLKVKEEIPDIIEMDEIYTFVKKNKNEQLYGLLILGDKAVLLRTSLEIKE